MTPAASARFRPGDRVRVRDAWPEEGGRRVHIRTPHFVRGRVGEVERVLGAFANPEDLAFGKPGLPPQPLYHVRFSQPELWPGGGRTDTLTVDIYESWLEAPR
ncbi:MAG: nitrile hydratase subunit beta [Rhodospirillales bacterium]|nr:nitrile hydratase subunit beta [Rhodospirillales bacterium]